MAAFRLTDFLKKKSPSISGKKIAPVIADAYSKEPVVIVDKTNEGIAVGSMVKITPAYASRYLCMSEYLDKPAEVIKISSRQEIIDSIEHTVICLWIRYPNENKQFMVSSIGYEKA